MMRLKTVMRLKTIWCGMRRRLLVYFFPVYVIKSLLGRHGRCKACGTCCKLNIPDCKYLKGNKCGLCKFGMQKDAKFWCWIFPIDRKDQELSGVEGVCGYHWSKELE